MKIIYIIIGVLSLGLGIIGIFVIALPTTPFLLLASYCFARGSQRFHNWFIRTGIYKKHLETFDRERSMTLSTKIKLLVFSSAMMMIPLFILKNIYVKVFLVLIIIFKYYFFIFKIRTLKSNKKHEVSEKDSVNRNF